MLNVDENTFLVGYLSNAEVAMRFLEDNLLYINILIS